MRRTSEHDAPTYFLFNEIHQLDKWAEQVQTLLSQSEQLHIAVTLPTEVPARNSRALSDVQSVLLPPKFYDFARMETAVPAANKEAYVYPIRKGLADQRKVDLATVVDECLTLQDQIVTEYDDVSSVVNDYLFNSGPRDEDGQGFATLKQQLQLVLYKDVQQFYPIEAPDDLFTLCVLVAQEPVQEYRFSRLTDQLDTDRRTIRKYLNILQKFLILSPSYKWGYQRHRNLRMYLRDPRYVSALNYLSDTNTDYRENLIHSVVYDHLRRLGFHLNDGTDIEMPVRYWDERNETVEYVLDVDGAPVPVALSTRRGEDAAIEAVLGCLDDTEATQGVVAGEDIRQPYAGGDQVLRLPLWMLLYLC